MNLFLFFIFYYFDIFVFWSKLSLQESHFSWQSKKKKQIVLIKSFVLLFQIFIGYSMRIIALMLK